MSRHERSPNLETKKVKSFLNPRAASLEKRQSIPQGVRRVAKESPCFASNVMVENRPETSRNNTLSLQ